MRYRLPVCVVLLLLQGCLSSGARIDRQAQAAHLTRTVVDGAGFRHVIYSKPSASSGAPHRLLIFLDGDGRPWDGRQPADDPTTRHPVALQLLAKTPVQGIYVSRPCYQQMSDPGCSPATWTSARYSAAVADSIAAAIRAVTRDAGHPDIVLVGYSGGGALAVLVAERLEHVTAVVTIAANLDIDAWTQQHNYLPLKDSLNPANSGTQHAWREIHLQGARDTVVPAATTTAYFRHFPDAQHWQFDDYDHVCCWADAWPEIFARIGKELDEKE